MSGRKIWTGVLFVVVVGFASFWLAVWAEDSSYGHFQTPGHIVEHSIVPVLPPPHQLENLGESILVEFLVDWAVSFLLVGFLYAGLKALRRRFAN
jgi:hypothetical protein